MPQDEATQTPPEVTEAQPAPPVITQAQIAIAQMLFIASLDEDASAALGFDGTEF